MSISKETFNRLLKDVRNIIKNPLTDQGIYYIHDDENMMNGYALIIGPSDTPYFGGNYFFKFKYPNDYPFSPPKVEYCTNGNNIRFNPNLYVCGKVCVSILNTWQGEQWTSCQTISTVLLTLCTLLCNNPLLNEPGVNINHPDQKSYNKIIEYSNVNIAVCDIIMKKQGVYLPFFENFNNVIKENFIKNYEKLHEFVTNKCNGEEKITNAKTQYYSMNININYEKLLEKLQVAKTLCDSNST